jgi:hypothetical protein
MLKNATNSLENHILLGKYLPVAKIVNKGIHELSTSLERGCESVCTPPVARRRYIIICPRVLMTDTRLQKFGYRGKSGTQALQRGIIN